MNRLGIRQAVWMMGACCWLLAWAGFGQEENSSSIPPVMELTGEPEGDALRLPGQPVDPRVYRMNDPAVSALAQKIENGSATLIERREWWWIEQRLAPFDKPVPPDWRLHAQAAIEAMGLEQSLRSLPGPTVSYTWTQVGPSTYSQGSDVVSGRASALWVDPSNKNTILLGTADGGVWKTTDQGSTWTSLFDGAASISIGSIAVDPNNKQVIYVGTGEGNFSIDAIGGVGIYKSTNGGATWSLLAGTSASNTAFRRIAVDPRDSNKVYAAGYNLWYSGNGGTSWSQTACGSGTSYPYFTDVVLDSVNGSGTTSIVYAALGPVWGGTNGANGIYRSTVGGAGPWTAIGTAAYGNGFPAANIARITLLAAPTDPKQMYALIQNVSTSQSLGIFYTANATDTPVTWTAKSATNYCAAQCWYDMTGIVDPTNAARLFVGGLDDYASTNNGGALVKVSNWAGGGSSFSHADHHHMAMPDATTLYDANDGGFFIGTVTWAAPSVSWGNKNAGLGTLQYYGYAQHPTDATKVTGGLQDNGQAYYNGTTWARVVGGDGGCSAWDQSSALYAYEEYVWAGIARNINMTGTPTAWTCIQNINGCNGCNGGCIPDGQTAFIAPFVLDANNQNTMYTGSKYLYTNAAPRTGSTWARTPPAGTDLTYGSGSAYITAIHSARNNGTSGILYVGTSNGRASFSGTSGSGWTDISTGLSGAWVTAFATDPANGLRVLATVSGYGAAHVYRSTTGSTAGTWTNITGALPAQPYNTIVLDPADVNHAYVGSDFGVYQCANVWAASPAWTSVTGNLPPVSVQQLGLVSGGKLRAATHGRGVWELSVSALSAPKEDSPSHDMKVAKGGGTALSVAFTNGCGALNNTVYTGDLGTLQSGGKVNWTGRYCSLGATSPLTFDPGSATGFYFVVVGNNTDGIEGSYGQASTGAERPPAGAGSPCQYSQNLTGTCP